MEQYIIIFIIVIVFFILCNNYIKYEYFSNQYLYPTKGLSEICSKENLYPSYMPKACYVNGKLNSYSNCKCQDEKGNCKLCYPEIKKDTKNANIVYNANQI